MSQNPKPGPSRPDDGGASLNDLQIGSAVALRPENLERAIPVMLDWIGQLRAAHLPASRAVKAYRFPNLPRYFPDGILDSARVCVVKETPVVPLAALGLDAMHQLFPTAAAGITFKNLYFVQEALERDESLHAHELVHVIQWDYLGPEAFLRLYGKGLVQAGYRGNPLEEMAYRLQKHFDDRGGRIDFSIQVRSELQRLERGQP